MVNYNPKVWLDLIFHSYGKQVMKTLLPALLFMGIFSSVICYIFLEHIEPNHFPSSTSAHSLLGIVLGLFLVFRTNSAYDRWWEGRKMWGSMVNNTRNLAHKMNAILDKGDTENRAWFAAMISNFVIATKEHLRAGVTLSDLENPGGDFLSRLQSAKHIPNRISSILYEKVNDLNRKGKMSGDQLIIVDRELKEFTDIMG